MKKFNLHFCTPWNECMMDGFRANILTPWYFIIIALNPDAKICVRLNEPCKWINIERIYAEDEEETT